MSESLLFPLVGMDIVGYKQLEGSCRSIRGNVIEYSVANQEEPLSKGGEEPLAKQWPIADGCLLAPAEGWVPVLR